MMDVSDAVIREVRPDEWPLLQRLSRQTFSDAFAAQNTPENMAKFLEEGFAEAKLRKELDDANSVFYFFESAGEIIAYMKLNWGASQTEIRDDEGLEIERIYVLKAFQGKQIGRLLFRKALSVARGRQARYLWLGVWEENLKAIDFYTKLGFVAFDKHIFVVGDDPQTDIMMKLHLP